MDYDCIAQKYTTIKYFDKTLDKKWTFRILISFVL